MSTPTRLATPRSTVIVTWPASAAVNWISDSWRKAPLCTDMFKPSCELGYMDPPSPAVVRCRAGNR
eukprot:scaffold1906_cov403-Prasinococcus_capsulatus_cf.AAC.14